MTTPALKRAARRSLSRHGQPLTHVSFSSSSTDAYGDEEWTETTQTVTGRIRQERSPFQQRDADETEARQKVTIYVDDSLDITDEHDTGRPDEFRLDTDGDGTPDYTWKVKLVEWQDNGLLACESRLVS